MLLKTVFKTLQIVIWGFPHSFFIRGIFRKICIIIPFQHKAVENYFKRYIINKVIVIILNN